MAAPDGVMDSHEIIKNSRRDKIRFTLRLFSNMSLIKETPIQQEHSIIGPAQKAVESPLFPAATSLLIEDFADSMPKEEKRTLIGKEEGCHHLYEYALVEFVGKKARLAELPEAD